MNWKNTSTLLICTLVLGSLIALPAVVRADVDVPVCSIGRIGVDPRFELFDEAFQFCLLLLEFCFSLDAEAVHVLFEGLTGFRVREDLHRIKDPDLQSLCVGAQGPHRGNDDGQAADFQSVHVEWVSAEATL